MTGFEAIDALLAGARQEAELPPAGQRRVLREALNLSRTQVARVLGVSPSTVGGWESGRDPSGEIREKYAYFLEGARTKLEDQAESAGEEESSEDPADQSSRSQSSANQDSADAEPDGAGADEVETLSAPQPCVLCGRPAGHQVAGFPQHLDPGECSDTAEQPQRPAPRAKAEAPAESAPTEAPPTATKPTVSAKPVKIVPVGRRVQPASELPDLIGDAVAAALAEHAGDVDAATAALAKRAIPDAMALLDETRKGGRYDIVAHP